MKKKHIQATQRKRVTPWGSLTKEEQERAYAPYAIYVPLDEFIAIRSGWIETSSFEVGK